MGTGGENGGMGQVGRDQGESCAPCSSRIVPEQLRSIASRCFWSIASEGNSTPALGNVPVYDHPTVKKFFLISEWNFLFIIF